MIDEVKIRNEDLRVARTLGPERERGVFSDDVKCGV